MLILCDAIIKILPRLLQDQRNATCYVNDKPRCVIIDYQKSTLLFVFNLAIKGFSKLKPSSGLAFRS